MEKISSTVQRLFAKCLCFGGQRLWTGAKVAAIFLACVYATVHLAMAWHQSRDWHSKKGWKAEDYFADAKVIALCKAIEAEDVDEIERLVKAGADVNAKGKGNMTPLLWAFPDNKLDRFKKLLELGADPNVVFESDFNAGGGIFPGGSVTQLAAGTAFKGQFEAVMKHGGDPHFVTRRFKESLIHTIIVSPASNKKERLQLLIDKKVDLNYISGMENTAVMTAVTWGGQYHIALFLLDAGADPLLYRPGSNKKLIHLVVKDEERAKTGNEQSLADYNKLLERLKALGESPEAAKADNKRWGEWASLYSGPKFRELMDKEIAERIAREKAEAEKKQQADKP